MRWTLGLAALFLCGGTWAQVPGPGSGASAKPGTALETPPIAPAAQSLRDLAIQRLRERAALASPMTPEMQAQREALLLQARDALNQGRSAQALLHLDAAAALSHAADTEMLIVQAQLQQGEFRPGLSFASHTAGAHLYEPQALRLYAWLLALSEQGGFAQRLLNEGLRRMPDQPGLLALQTQLSRLQPGAEGERSAALAASRPGPWPVQAQDVIPPVLSQPAQASGLLLDQGRLALLPLDALSAADGAERFWVCNGLGFGSRAQVLHRDEALGLALLRLEHGLPPGSADAPLSVAPRDAFAGSVASAFSHLSSPLAAPAWPAMHSGFLGRYSMATPGQQALGIGLAW